MVMLSAENPKWRSSAETLSCRPRKFLATAGAHVRLHWLGALGDILAFHVLKERPWMIKIPEEVEALSIRGYSNVWFGSIDGLINLAQLSGRQMLIWVLGDYKNVTWEIRKRFEIVGMKKPGRRKVPLFYNGKQLAFASMSKCKEAAFTFLIYPCLILAYMGEAAFLSKHHEDVQRSFYQAIPETVFWPVFVVATLASVVGSQAAISATFSIRQHQQKKAMDGDSSSDSLPVVNFSATRSSRKAFTASFKETFFPDDPFRQFKGQPPLRCTYNILKYLIPALEWLPQYNFRLFRYDLLSGITIASLAIPQGISYAKLGDLPPIIGLYSSFVPPLIYAMFGTSKDMAVGTVAAASLLLASIISAEVSPTEDPQLYVNLFITAAFFTGVFQTALGFLRVGILVDFLSKSTIVGFMSGTAVIIIFQQFKGMLGLKHFTTHTDVISVLRSIFSQTNEWRWESAVAGICFLGFLLSARFLSKKKPKLFWVSAISPLFVVVLGCIVAYFAHADKHGIPTYAKEYEDRPPPPLQKGVFYLAIFLIALGNGGFQSSNATLGADQFDEVELNGSPFVETEALKAFKDSIADPLGALRPGSESFLQCNTEEESVELVKLLLPTQSALLNWAVELMADVVEEDEANKMNARNIAMVFAPIMTQMADPLTALMHAVSNQHIDDFDSEEAEDMSCESREPASDDDQVYYSHSIEEHDRASLNDIEECFLRQLDEGTEDVGNDANNSSGENLAGKNICPGCCSEDNIASAVCNSDFNVESGLSISDGKSRSSSTSDEEDSGMTIEMGCVACIWLTQAILKVWAEVHKLPLLMRPEYLAAMDAVCMRIGVRETFVQEGFQNLVLRNGCE
ncbi:hypothetical protein ACLOJK_038553 [Asimina triloba]